MALVLAACGSDEQPTGERAEPARTQAQPTTAPETQAQSQPEEAEPQPESASGATGVTIEEFEYRPPEAKVDKGATVRWVNRDSANHTVTFEDEDLGDLAQGQTRSRTFEKTGEFSYVCTYHPSMKGRVVVG